MTPKKKPRFGLPYTYVTWLTKLLADEAQCYYQLWFKAHYQYDKIEDANFNLAQWSIDHNELVDARAAVLRRDGYVVTREDVNAFKIKGKTALLSGKPDIIARTATKTLVSDGKTGKRRNSDFHQVLIYMLAIKRQTGNVPTGEVVYRENVIVPVTPEMLTPTRENRIYALMRVAGGTSAPSATPSAKDCAWCDIPKALCPHRIEIPEPLTVETSDF